MKAEYLSALDDFLSDPAARDDRKGDAEPVIAVPESRNITLARSVSFYATFLFLVAVVALYAPPQTMSVVREVLTFLTGGVKQVTRENPTLLVLAPLIALMVLIELPVCMLTSTIVRWFVGKHSGHELEKKPTGQHAPIFMVMFAFVVLEELFARAFFLGLLPKLSFLSGSTAFYLLMLTGNALWAALHIHNYKRPQDRQMVRVLPQFVSGILFSFCFVKFGFLATALLHFASNAVVFSLGKVQRTSLVDLLIVILHGVYAVLSWVFMTKPITDITQWFTGGDFVLSGWEFKDYFLLSLFLSSCCALIFDLLLYDKNSVGAARGKLGILASKHLLLSIFAICVLSPVLTYTGYWLLGFVVHDIATCVFVLALFSTFLVMSPSASAAMRAFWTGIPQAFVTICIIEALGWFGAMALMATQIVIHAPHLYLNEHDD